MPRVRARPGPHLLTGGQLGSSASDRMAGAAFCPEPEPVEQVHHQADSALTGLAQAAARFPEAAGRLRRLALSDPAFRVLCEDYGLAQESLARFEALRTPPSGQRSRTYRSIIARGRDRQVSEGGETGRLTDAPRETHWTIRTRPGYHLEGTPGPCLAEIRATNEEVPDRLHHPLRADRRRGGADLDHSGRPVRARDERDAGEGGAGARHLRPGRAEPAGARRGADGADRRALRPRHRHGERRRRRGLRADHRRLPRGGDQDRRDRRRHRLAADGAEGARDSG